MKYLKKIVALSLALMLTLMTVLPSQAGLNLVYAETGSTDIAAEESADVSPDEIYHSEDKAAPANAGDHDSEAGKDSNKNDKDDNAASAEDKSADTDSAKAGDQTKDQANGTDADAESGEDAETDEADASGSDDAASTIEFEGKEFDVTIESSPEAGLPADTELSAREITAKDDEYEEYYEKALEAARDDAEESDTGDSDTRAVRFVRLYDMTLTSGEDVLEPEAAVDVTIDYTKAVDAGKAETAEDPDGIKVINLSENNKGELEGEVLDEKTTEATIDNTALTETKFEAESFNVYAVVYTVDFHYGDGEYDFSIAGESSIMLSEIIERLHMGALTINDVKDAKFSDPDLINVEKVKGAVDADNGTTPADDWKLTSLKPFDTDETLTLTLNDDSVVEVKVTDASSYGYKFKVVRDRSQEDLVGNYETFEDAVDAINEYRNPVRVYIGDIGDNYIVNSSLTFTSTRNYQITIYGNNNIIKRGSNVTGDFITNNRTSPLIIKDLTIDGGDNSNGALLKKNVNGAVSLNNVRFQGKCENFYCATAGSGDVVLENCILDGERTTGHIINQSGTGKLTLTGCTIQGPFSGNGSLIYRGASNNMGETSITSSELYGGGINAALLYLKGNTDTRSCLLNIRDCTINCQKASSGALKKTGNYDTNIDNCTIIGPEVQSSDNLVEIKSSGAITISNNCNIYRGNTTGAAVSNTGTGKLTIANSTISGAKSASDSSSVSSSEPLVKSGTGELTLTDATIEKHVASANGVCAVDASSLTGTNALTISGNTTITGNTANGEPANVKVSSSATNVKFGSLTGGNIGITTSHSSDQFGTLTDASNMGYEKLIYDQDANRHAFNNGTALYWSDNFVVISGNYVSTHPTFEEAVAKANTYTTSTIKAFVSEYIMQSAVTLSKQVIVQPENDANRFTIKRGNVTGNLISSSGALTLDRVTLDGENKPVEGSLLKMTANAALTLTDTVVQKHDAEAAEVCAVDASLASHVFVEGNTTITGNTANSKPANLKVQSDNVLRIDGGKRLSGHVGVYNSDNNTAGSQFAHLVNLLSSKGWHNFSNDINPDLVATTQAHKVMWRNKTVYDTVQDPSPDADAYEEVNYPVTKSVTVEHDLEIVVPFSKTLTLNKEYADSDVTSFEDVKFVFHIEVISGDSDGVETPEYKLPMSTVLTSGTKSANTYTYVIPDWKIKFTKEGDYTLRISESAVESADGEAGITKDTSTKTLSYKVVENEGFLRIAEIYKSSDEEITDTKIPEHNQSELSLDKLFNVSSVLHDKLTGKAIVTKEDGTITLEMSTPSSAAVYGAITTNYSFDFSRSFEISGNLTMPQEDGFAIAFQSKKKISAREREGGYALDMHNFDTAAGTDQIIDYFRNGSKSGSRITASDMEKGFLFVVQNEPISGIASFLIDGATTRKPYPATNDPFTKLPVIDEYDEHYVKIGSGDMIYASDALARSNAGTAWPSDSAKPYKIKFTCSDPAIGKGKLTITIFGRDFEYDNFVAKNILGSAWREAFFVVGACEDNTASAKISILDSHYTDGIRSADASFWADRNGDGRFETQVNTTDSLAIPGETILVRHDLVSTEANGFDHDYYIKTLITQLKDITAGSNLTPINDSAVSWVSGQTKAYKVKDYSTAGVNSTVLSDGMFVAVHKDTAHTYFEYKIKAPTEKRHTVIESALFGEPPFDTVYTKTIGFKTENIPEQSATLNNNASVSQVTFDPNGGTLNGSTDNKVLSKRTDTLITITETPVRENHFFKGWLCSLDNQIYQVSERVKITEDTTFTAQWQNAVAITLKECDTNGTALQDGKFELYDGANKLLTAISDSEGKIIIPYGNEDGQCPFTNGKTYTLKQTEAPANYAIPGFSWNLAVDNNGTINVADASTGVQTDSANPPAKVKSLGMVKTPDGNFEVYNEPYNVLVLKNDTDVVYNLTEVFGNNGSVFQMNGTANTNWGARPATVAADGGEVRLAIINKAENTTGNRFNLKGTFNAHEGDVIKATMTGQTAPQSPTEILITKGGDGKWSTYHSEGHEKNVSANLGDAGNTVTVTFTLDSYYTYLKVTKQLPGEYDNRKADYTFTVTGMPSGTHVSKVTDTSSGTTEELASDTFTLKHDEDVILRVPADKDIAITETPVEGYGVDIVTTGVSTPSTAVADKANGKVTVNLKARYTTTAPAAVTFTNTLSSPVVPSGLKLAGGILAGLLIVGGMAAYVVYTIRRRRYAHEE